MPVTRIALALSLAALGCGGSPSSSAPEQTAPEAPDLPPRAVPAPGVDLAGPIPAAPPAATGAVAGRDVPALDLDADRALVRVAVPRLPRGASTTFAFDGEKRGWATRIPDSRQLPTAAFGDGRIYISGGFDSVNFYALEATTGRIEWATTNLEDNGPTSAVFEDDRVIFNTESCTLFALDARTGKRLWHKYLGDPTLAQTAVADGLIYAAHPHADGPMLSAFKVKNGATRWRRYVGAELLATPVIHGDSVYATTIHGVTYRFNRKTGKKMWSKRLRATTAPWIVGDEMFVTRRRKGNTEEQIVVSVASGKILRQHHAQKGKYLWDVPHNLDDWRKIWAFEGSRPVVTRGVRYDAMGGHIRATDATTGAELWHRRYAPKASKRSVGTVALAGPQVVVATRTGQVYGLDVDTGYTLWAYDIGAHIVAQPIVAKGWAYLTTGKGYVVALQVGDKTLDGWHMFGGNAKHNI